jgi:hypothetical protein
LRSLREKVSAEVLGKRLPETRGEIERLTTMRGPEITACAGAERFAKAMVFFVTEEEQALVEGAIARAGGEGETRARRRSAGLVRMARWYVEKEKDEECG